jgi:4-hydroxybenzoate polyprenyltransferase
VITELRAEEYRPDLGRSLPAWADRAYALVETLRPQQWTKNALCLAGVVFGPGQILLPGAWGRGLATALVFCAGSSAVYVLNDLLDRRSDRDHPHKRWRPIARGSVGVPAAVVLGLAAVAAGLVGAYVLGPAVLVCLALYLGNNLAYSLCLKHLALLDVLSIAAGFVLRLVAGVYVLGDVPTTWITLCTFFLAVFLGLGKRRAELAGLPAGAERLRRAALGEYTIAFLDLLLASSSVMAVMCYALFTVVGKNPSLVVTLPFVFFGILHYQRLILVLRAGEEPDRILLHDRAIQASIVLWLTSYFTVMCSGAQLFR